MSGQRISLSEDDFKKLCRGEIVTHLDLQVVLQDAEHCEFEHLLRLDEGERQMIVLAMAELGLSRPGWDDALRRVAGRIDNPGTPMYERFKRSNSDRVQAERGPLVPQRMILEQDEEEVRRWIHGINPGRAHSCENYVLLRPALLALKAKFPKYRFSGVL